MMKHTFCTFDTTRGYVPEPTAEDRYAQSIFCFTPEQILGCNTMDDLEDLKVLARQMISNNHAPEISRN